MKKLTLLLLTFTSYALIAAEKRLYSHSSAPTKRQRVDKVLNSETTTYLQFIDESDKEHIACIPAETVDKKLQEDPTFKELLKTGKLGPAFTLVGWYGYISDAFAKTIEAYAKQTQE